MFLFSYSLYSDILDYLITLTIMLIKTHSHMKNFSWKKIPWQNNSKLCDHIVFFRIAQTSF